MLKINVIIRQFFFSSMLLHFLFNRGETFRPEYEHLGEVKSLFPSGVNIMALTATASAATCSDIIATLCMDQPVIISASPHKKTSSILHRRKSHLICSLLIVDSFVIMCKTNNPFYDTLNLLCSAKSLLCK